MAGEEPTEELFGLAPEAFVAARDELARRLRRAGDPGAAAAVRALRRPSLSAWAVNQLARRRRPELEPLLAGEREAVAGLVEAALELLGEAGHPPTAAARARRGAAVAARDEAHRRARLAADQAVLATRQAERLGRLADQAEREAARARATAAAAIEAASAARERAARAARELHDAEDRIPGER